MKTELGRIAGLIDRGRQRRRTRRCSRSWMRSGASSCGRHLGIVALLFGLGLLRGTAPLELFMTSVSLAVAAVPEGLAGGGHGGAVARRAAHVAPPRAGAQAAGGRDAGLHHGDLHRQDRHADGGRDDRARALRRRPEATRSPAKATRRTAKCDSTASKRGMRRDAAPLLELATLLLGCNNAHLLQEDGIWKVIGDPTEGALLAAGAKAGGDRERIEQELPKQHEIPFDSDRKRSSVIRRTAGWAAARVRQRRADVLLQRCTQLYTASGVRPLTAADREQIVAQIAAMAQQALRVLGSAYRDLDAVDHRADLEPPTPWSAIWCSSALTGMYDPPRPEAKEAVAKCHAAGIRVVMITGDHPHTATAIARELGIAPARMPPSPASSWTSMSDARTAAARRRRSPSMHASPLRTSCASSAPGRPTMRWSR